MIAGQDAGTLVVLALALLTSGIVGGLLAGLLGVGGGIVLVPVLFYVFTAIGVDPGVRMHMAVGTSLMAMIPTSVRSALAHYKHGAVDMDLLRLWAVPAIAGAVAGIWLASRVKGPVLMAVFAFFASLAALHMAFGKDTWRIASQLPGKTGQSFMALGIAGVSVMMGIGGGTFTVPTLTLFGYPIHRAVGTASAIGVLIAIPGAIGAALSGLGVADRPPLSLGYASLIGVALIIPATFVAAPWGARLAHKLDRALLRRVFALFLGVTGVRMIFALFQ